MILVDFSSILHRKLYTAIANVKPSKNDGEYVTSEFINVLKYFIVEELVGIQLEFKAKYGDMVLCLDNSTKDGYWRKDVYQMYKSKRKTSREKSEINFGEVFQQVNELVEQINLNLPIRVVSVPRAEADDTMLILAKESNENVLIHSPDKDMIQSQRHGDHINQYSSLTKKWLTADAKAGNMDNWIYEHCVLGDAADEVPKVVDHTIFTDVFIEHIQTKALEFDKYSDMITVIKSPYEFKNSKLPNEIKREILNSFDVYQYNKKGENTGIKDVYKKERFGITTFNKAVKKFGSFDDWLDSNPLYRPHYERNFTLVMEEGIPEYIRDGIITAYNSAPTVYNDVLFEQYIKDNGLNNILQLLPAVFKVTRELTADDFGW